MAMTEIKGVGQSARETVFLGPTSSDEHLKKVTVATAERLRKEVFETTGDDALKRRNVNAVLSDLTGGAANDVSGLDKKIKDSGNSDQTLILAREVLANSTFLLLRDGGDKARTDALNSGVASRIENVLPEALKPLAREVRDRVITNPEIVTVIEQIDAAAVENMWGLMPPLPQERVEVLNGAWTRLKNLNIQANDPDRAQYTRAFIFLRSQIRSLSEEINGAGTVQQQGDPNTNALIEAIKGTETSKVSFNEWVDSLKNDAAYTVHSEAMPLWYTDPKLVGITDFEGAERLGDWQALVGVSTAADNWVAYKKSGGYKFEDLFNNPEIMGIKQATVTEMWSKEKGLRWAAREIFQHLYTRDTSFPDPNVFAIRLWTKEEIAAKKKASERARIAEAKRTNKNINEIPNNDWEFDVEAAANRWSKYLDRLAHKMVESGVVDNLDLAKIYAATASHLFSDTTAVDSSDSRREYNGRALDPIRSLMRSEEKAMQKAGIVLKNINGSWVLVNDKTEKDQQFGGRLADLMRRLVDLNGMPEITRIHGAAEHGRMLYFPKATCLSWAEMTTVRVDDREMSVAEMLMTTNDSNATEVVFGRGGDDSLYGPYKRDLWPAAVYLGLIFKGSTPLDDKSMAEWQKEFSNQRTEILKIGRPGDSNAPPMMEKILNDPRFVAMAITNSLAAATGADLPLHEEVLMPVSDEYKYDVLLDRILSGLTGMDESFKKQVRAVLHANKMSVMVGMAEELTPAFSERKRIRRQAGINISRARARKVL